MLKWCEQAARSFNERDPLQQVIVTKAENFGDFGGMMIEDQDSGLNLYNLYFHAMGLHVGSRGHTWADLTNMVRVQQDGLRWDKVGTFFQKYGALWESKVKIMPLDGDFHSLFYRLDLFEEYGMDPPVDITLEEFVEVGEHFQGRDLNDDGEPDFGICFPHNGYASPYYFLALLAPWLQYSGSSQGIFFDPDTMEPLFDNAASHEVLRLWKRTWMAPDPMDATPTGEGSTLQAFLDGRCAMALGWDEHFSSQRPTWANGKVGVAKAPGTSRIWDRSRKQLAPCTPELCPHAVERRDGRLVNFAPYNAFNGFSMAINGASSVAQINTAFALMAFLMSEESRRLVVFDGLQVADNQSTFFSSVSPEMYDADRFVQAGFRKASVDTYVDNGQFSISSGNAALELRFKGDTMRIYGKMMALMYDYYREQGEYNMTSQQAASARTTAGEKAVTARVAMLVQSMWAGEVAKDPVGFKATYQKMLGIYDGPAACQYGERFETATGTCEMCPAGKFGSYDKLNCQECSAGSAASQPGMSLCRECAPGTHQSASGQELCLNCTAGRYSAQAASSDCIDCPAGRYTSDRGARECALCPVAAHQDLAGQSSCLDCPHGQITSEWTLVQDRYRWVPTEGAENISACGCGEGTRLLSGICVDCGNKDSDGLLCRGKDDVIVSSGFYAEDTSFFVFKCHGHESRCIGGEPGSTCAAGREGIACAQCKDGFKDQNDGTCVPCDTGVPGEVSFTVFSVLCCIVFFSIYIIIDRGRGTRPSHTVLLLVLVFSVTVTLVQQFGIISLFEHVDWMEPVSTLLGITRILVLDVEVLHVNCVLRMSSLHSFMLQVSVMGMAAVVVLIAHTLFTVIVHKAAFTSRIPALLESMGTIFMASYISVVTTVLGPFQCLSHPNGEQTVRGFPSVICWATSEHLAMIAIATLAVQVPLAFYAYCFRATCQYPYQMSVGNTAFLQMQGWLFFRYKPEVYWYSIVSMSRSLLLATLPIVPNSLVQIIGMDILMVGQLVLVVGVKPWRLQHINVLDNVFTVSTLMILICASFYIDRLSDSSLAWFASTLMLLCILVLPAVVVLTIVLRCTTKSRKHFDYFLCHHKAAAGAFARLLKHQLKTDRLKGEVFVDADNLATLDTLFDFVAYKTDTLVLIGSKDLLQRPWCIGEITTAKAAVIRTFKLALPDFSNPTDKFIDEYADIVGDLSVLTSNGIALSAAQEAMRWFRDLREVHVPVELTGGSLKEVSSCILHGTYTTLDKSSPLPCPGSEARIKIIADTQSLEACSAAILLGRMLAPRFIDKPSYLPQLMHSGDSIPEAAAQCLLICSAGVLEKEHIIQALAAAVDRELAILPILVDDGFQFPSKSFTEEHRSLMSAAASSGIDSFEVDRSASGRLRGLVCQQHSAPADSRPVTFSWLHEGDARSRPRQSSAEEHRSLLAPAASHGSNAAKVDASLNGIRDIFMTIGIDFPAKMASEKTLLTKTQEIAERLEAMISMRTSTATSWSVASRSTSSGQGRGVPPAPSSRPSGDPVQEFDGEEPKVRGDFSEASPAPFEADCEVAGRPEVPTDCRPARCTVSM